jgi:hypothetical protein
MMADWTRVFSSTSQQEAELVRGVLETNGIQAVVMDGRPSPYPQLGEIEVYVVRDDVMRALYLVRKHQGT